MKNSYLFIKQEQVKEEKKLYIALLIAIVSAFILIIIYDGLHDWDGLPIALLWAFACLASGGIIGFLFAIPRVIPFDVKNQNSASLANVSGQFANNRLGVNTNIEQVSDWLTKIIVGLGLVHLKDIFSYINQSATTLSRALGAYGNDGPHAFSIAIIVYFTIVGFIAGYLLTRIYISALISSADYDMSYNYISGEIPYENLQVPNELKTIISEPELTTIFAETASGTSLNQPANEKLAATYRKISKLKEEQIADPVSIAAWATSQLNLGNSEKALDAFKKAIDTFTNDVKLRFEYALALQRVKKHKEAIAHLEKALKLNEVKGDKTIEGNIVTALMFSYLYISPPEGFQKSINLGEKYVSDPFFSNISWIWVNLTAGYGQQARFAREHSEYPFSFEASRDKALNAMRQAIALNKNSKATFNLLIQSNVPKPEGEDDLEIFEEDNDFRKLLDLPLI